MKTDEGIPFADKARFIKDLVVSTLVSLGLVFGFWKILELFTLGGIPEKEFYGIEAAIIAALYAVSSAFSSGVVLDSIDLRLDIANIHAKTTNIMLGLISTQNKEASYQREMIIMLLQNPKTLSPKNA